MSDPKGNPVSLEDWEQQYQSGRWSYLGNPHEMARYAVIAGYLHRYCETMRILDVGGGEGILWNHVDQSRVSHYTLIDLSPSALNMTKIPEEKRTLIAGDIDEYEFPPETQFDAIVFNEVLSYPRNPMRSLNAFTGNLAPNGLIIVSLWHSPDPNTTYTQTVSGVWNAIDKGPWTGLDETAVTNIPTRRTWRIRAMTAKS